MKHAPSFVALPPAVWVPAEAVQALYTKAAAEHPVLVAKNLVSRLGTTRAK